MEKTFEYLMENISDLIKINRKCRNIRTMIEEQSPVNQVPGKIHVVLNACENTIKRGQSQYKELLEKMSELY